MTLHRVGETMAGLDCHMRIRRQVPADGRPLRAEARLIQPGGDCVVVEAILRDADGTLIGENNTSAAFIDNTRRKRKRRPISERVLCTLLFTDIVDSTKHAERLGDARWQTLLETHHETARNEIALCSGREVKSTGDGLFVRFDSPGRALECARRIRAAVGRLGIEIRAGLHSGECEIQVDDVVGMAVHLAARIQGEAAPGEIIVSSTVRDLTAGSGFQFEDCGMHEMKGIPEPWHLWTVV
jgi:class 3 adenylate cyclase